MPDQRDENTVGKEISEKSAADGRQKDLDRAAARRRFVMASLLTPPTVMTLGARRAGAATPSAVASGAHSGP